ncbi:MAG: rhomboid family intramembrane serine protease [Bacteroidales bacterium]|nr:rhomboid family intramembrane serine protease [Bacteroidales bacterium]
MYKNSVFGNNSSVSTNIIIINVLIWIACLILPKYNIDLQNILGLHFIPSSDFKLYQLITYMFVHSTPSPAHIFFNMFAVFMFGRVIENTWGPARFLTFYLITGIGAGIVQQLAWWYDLRDLLSSSYEMINLGGTVVMPKAAFLNQIVTIGASGAVFGILLAFGMLYPNVPLFIMFIPIPIKAKYVVIGYGLIELVSGIGNFTGDNIAHFAHLGGMLFGYILIKFWQKKR